MTEEDDKAPPERVPGGRAQPWNVGSVVPWSVVATLGEPILLLAPMAATLAGIVAVLGAGAGSTAECVRVAGCPAHLVVPLWTLPPFDAYQDAGAIGLAASSAPVVWLLRAAALVARAAVFGVVAHLALQRVLDRAPEPALAVRAVRGSIVTLLALELASFAGFGIPLVLGQQSLLAPGRPVAQLGALIGQMLLVNAFFAAFTEPGPLRAFVAGLRWTTKRPLGHVALAVLATAASNGVFWLSRAGEPGRPSGLTLVLFALLHALVATMFITAFARRWALLYQR